MPRYYDKLEDDFLAATGITLNRYYEILVLFITHINSGLGPGKHWMSKESLCSQVRANRDDLERFLARWA